jgi:hypothetical protein
MGLGRAGKARGAAKLCATGGDHGQTEQRFIGDLLAACFAADGERVAQRARGLVKLTEEQPGNTLIGSEVEERRRVAKLARRVDAFVQPRERVVISVLYEVSVQGVGPVTVARVARGSVGRGGRR